MKGKGDNMEIIKINNDTWQCSDGGVRFFLLAGSERALLIDSGMTVHNAKEIAEELVHVPVELLNTHADPDHIGSNAEFDEFYMNPAESVNYYKSQGRCGRMIPVSDGDVIDLGGRKLEIIHIPGHTPGSIAVLDRRDRALFSGDPVQKNGGIFMFGPLRELHAYILSLLKLEAMSDRFDLIYPSHAESPITPDVIPALRKGTERVLSGEIKGELAEMHGRKIRRCDVGVSVLLCDE